MHHVRSLPAEDVAVRDGIRVTTVARTLIDLCGVAEPEVVELALESALRRRSVGPVEIAATLARFDRKPNGSHVIRSLLVDRSFVATESALEALVWRLLRDSGLPPPVRQYEVSLGQKVVARVDFAYPQALIAIEADGYEFHSARDDWQRDRKRQNALAQLGWLIYTITWEDVMRRGRRVVDDVTRLLTMSDPARSRSS